MPGHLSKEGIFPLRIIIQFILINFYDMSFDINLPMTYLMV